MLKIINGEVYDPAHNINGEVRDICIEDGQIVASVSGWQNDRCVRNGGHAGRSGYALPHCRAQSEYRPQNAPGRPSPGSGAAHVLDPLRRRQNGALDFCHRLSLCGDGLHDCLRCRRASHGRAPCARRIHGHPGNRQGFLCADGEQRIHHAADRRRASAKKCGTMSPGCCRRPKAMA